MFYPSRIVLIGSTAVLLATLMACAPMNTAPSSTPVTNFPTSSTPANTQGAYVEFGRVSNVEIIRVQDPARAPGIGAVIGGVAGAVVGNQIGSGTGRTAATVIGAVGGAVAGNAIEKSRTANTAAGESYRVTVQLDNGSVRAYDTSSYGELRIGDRVRIENGQLTRTM